MQQTPWDVAWPLIQNVIFLILGIMGTAVYERYRHVQDDYELWIDHISDSMMKGGSRASELSPLEYSVNGRTVKDPFEVELCVWATGKKDIGPERFNSEELVIKLGVPIVSELDGYADYNAAEAAAVVDPIGEIVIDPSVIRGDMAIRWKLVTDGRPSLDFNKPFLDAKVRSWFAEYEKPKVTRRAMKVSGIIAMTLVPLAVVGMVLLNLFTDLSAGAIIAPFLVAAPVLLFSGMMLLAQSDGPGRLLKRARKALDARIPDSLKWERLVYSSDDPFQPRFTRGRRVHVAGHPSATHGDHN